MELIRKIALFFEEAETEWIDHSNSRLRQRNGRPAKGILPDIEGYTDEEIMHSLSVMSDAGLLIEYAEYLGADAGKPSVVLARRLGWHGHEFLDAVRDEEAFDRVQQAADKAKNWTMQFILEAAQRIALQQLGL